VDNLSKTEAAVGIYCPEKAEIGKNMIPYSDGFYTVGIPALNAVLNSDSQWFAMDEIGFLESNETQFQQALLTAMESRNLIAVVRETEKGVVPFIDKILSRDDAFVIDLAEFDNADYWE
jgi:nucleoside-triphosphatase THEP1